MAIERVLSILYDLFIHSDLHKTNGVLTKARKKYTTTFVDDTTKYFQMCLLKIKHKVLDYFKIYNIEAENQLDKRINRLRSNQSKGYFSNGFS